MRPPHAPRTAAAVLKIGGELLEPNLVALTVRAAADLATTRPLAIVHGAGREIDAEMNARGIAKRAVDGLRITDAPALEAVIAVLAGTVHTRLVAALNAAGVPAVGLTGADAGLPRCVPAPPYRTRDGRLVDLGLVGAPDAAQPAPLVDQLVSTGYVPVVASVGAAADGSLLNVNADVFAARLATMLGAAELLIAGGTAGVLDGAGRTIPELDPDAIVALIDAGDASAGMVVKLRACSDAREGGVERVSIFDGRTPDWSRPSGVTRLAAGARPTRRAG
jgi:acetylglutamate kinase